jgi:hypothetical protein
VIAHRGREVATRASAAAAAIAATVLGFAATGQANAQGCVCAHIRHRAVHHHAAHAHVYHHYYYRYAAAYPPPPEPLYYEDYYPPPPVYYGPAGGYGYDYAVPLAFGLGALVARGHHPYYGWGGHGGWGYGGGYYHGFHGGGLHRGWDH